MTGINNYETVGDCVTPYIHGREAWNSASLVCRKWCDIDRATRKHVKVHLYYAPSPSRLAERFPFIESLTLKGFPDKDKFPHKSNIDVTPWIEQIAVKFKCLESLQIRNLAIHDSDLELLSRTRGRDLKVLKIHKCGGFSEIGLTYISKSCNELRTFILDDVLLHNAKDGKWLHEFALHNTVIETFDFSNYHYPFDAKDVVHLVKNCSQSLVSLGVGTSCCVPELGVAFKDAIKLEHFSGGYYIKNMEHVPQYSSFMFPATIRCLGGIYDPSKSSTRFVLPISNQLRELNLHGSGYEANCQCFLIARCPNLEVLRTKDACGDRGMQIISSFCRKLRKLEFCNPSGVTCMGLIAVAKVCRNLEYLYVYLTDISNEALECIGDNLKNLRDFHMYLCERENYMETELPLDRGIRAMLIGCTKLERLSIRLLPGQLTDAGLWVIGMYGVNLRYLFLERIRGSDEGLRALSMGCPRLRKLEMKSCDFSEQAIASIVFKINTLRYVLLLNDEGDVLLALTRPNFGDSTMETQQVLAELEPYVILAEKLDKIAVAAGVGGQDYVKVTYASTRVSDYLDAQLLRAMIAKRANMSVKRVILDGSSERPVKSIQVQIAEVKLICFAGAISESWNIIVEGQIKNGVPRLTRVGAFEVNATLQGNIILCVVDPEIAGSSKSLLSETNLQGSFTRLSRTVGKQVLRVIVVDKKPRLKTLKKIQECPGVKQVLCVAL